MPIPDNYNRSATNPTATADQRDVEALAMRIYKMPVVAKTGEPALVMQALNGLLQREKGGCLAPDAVQDRLDGLLRHGDALIAMTGEILHANARPQRLAGFSLAMRRRLTNSSAPTISIAFECDGGQVFGYMRCPTRIARPRAKRDCPRLLNQE